MIRIAGSLFVAWVIALPVAAGDTSAKETVAFLRKLQEPSGGFLTAPARASAPAAATLRATSAAVRALHYFGGEVPDKTACIRYVESCFDAETGGFRDTPKGKPDLVTTAIGLMAVAELKMPAKKYGGAVKVLSDGAKTFEDIRIAVAGLEAIKARSPKNADWIKAVRKLQNADGTFGAGLGQARDTGGSAVALLRMGVKLDHDDAVLQAIRKGQRADGGWGKADSASSDLETTYRVMRCFMMMKAKPNDVPALRAYLAKCRNPDGGYGAAPGQPSTVSGAYYAGSILHWLSEPRTK